MKKILVVLISMLISFASVNGFCVQAPDHLCYAAACKAARNVMNTQPVGEKIWVNTFRLEDEYSPNEIYPFTWDQDNKCDRSVVVHTEMSEDRLSCKVIKIEEGHLDCRN